MRHDHVLEGREFDVVDVAAIWPRAGAIIQPPAVEPGSRLRPATAVPDMPAAVGAMIVGIYTVIMAIFFITMATGAHATMMIVIAALYVAMFLAVPRIFLAVEADPAKRPSMAEFNARGIDTFTGHLSGRAALVQILVVPVLLSLPLLIIGGVAMAVLP